MSIQKRTYNSENRSAQAAQTKKRILAAARSLFMTEGFDGMKIENLAKVAQVSTPTIYSLFQSKKGVLFALMDEAVPMKQVSLLIEEAKKEICPVKRIGYGAKIARCVYDAERSEMEIFRGAAVLAPEFKELENEKEQRRYGRQEETIKTLMSEKALLKELSLPHARDILWALTGRDLYRMLVVERGWSSDEYEVWLADVLVKTLIKE